MWGARKREILWILVGLLTIHFAPHLVCLPHLFCVQEEAVNNGRNLGVGEESEQKYQKLKLLFMRFFLYQWNVLLFLLLHFWCTFCPFFSRSLFNHSLWKTIHFEWKKHEKSISHPLYLSRLSFIINTQKEEGRENCSSCQKDMKKKMKNQELEFASNPFHSSCLCLYPFVDGNIVSIGMNGKK